MTMHARVNFLLQSVRGRSLLPSLETGAQSYTAFLGPQGVLTPTSATYPAQDGSIQPLLPQLPPPHRRQDSTDINPSGSL